MNTDSETSSSLLRRRYSAKYAALMYGSVALFTALDPVSVALAKADAERRHREQEQARRDASKAARSPRVVVHPNNLALVMGDDKAMTAGNPRLEPMPTAGNRAEQRNARFKNTRRGRRR